MGCVHEGLWAVYFSKIRLYNGNILFGNTHRLQNYYPIHN